MRKILTTLSLLALVPALWGAEKVALHFMPDSDARIIAELEPDDAKLALAEDVIEKEKKEEGWQWLEYEGTFKGYVALDDVGKDLEVAPGALIRLDPDPDSPILTVVEEGDDVELIWAGDWAEVKFTKEVPVYFKKASPELPTIEFDSPADSMEGENIASGDPDTVEGGPSVYKNKKDGMLPRYFEGTLQKASGSLGRKPKYKLQLEDRKGKRIAFVDTSNLLISTPVESFVEKDVILYGGAITLSDSKDIVIVARTIRLR